MTHACPNCGHDLPVMRIAPRLPGLTRRQTDVFLFVRDFEKRHNRPPNYDEIARGAGFTSKESAYYVVGELIARKRLVKLMHGAKLAPVKT